ncbi:MAG: hypothetical protein MZV70_60825 [Desulfobacterales bacterium]|nr:hypothetical protein [Desulfobacterales bacterium]
MKEHSAAPLAALAKRHPWAEAMAFGPGSLWPCLSDGSLTSRAGRLSLQLNHGRAI